MNEKQRIGKWGEDYGVSYLKQNGYTILERNYRTPQGEIDIIAAKDGGLIFVEVRTRSSNDYGFPEHSVTPRKQRNMQSAARSFLEKQHEYYATWQFDILAITRQSDAAPEIVHIENIIS